MKLVNLERLQEKSLNTLIQEAHTMAGLYHENVLPLHCSFITGEDLWLVMPYVAGGNLSELLRSQVTCCLRIMHVLVCASNLVQDSAGLYDDGAQFPTGMDEDMIVTIAKDILKGLDYLHRRDLAHRDLKVYKGHQVWFRRAG